MVGLGKSKLPKAGLEHREILPPSSCEDRDYGWVAGSQQSPIENLQVDSTTINQSRRKDLYIMYIGLGTLQTVYCILCKGAIILAMSAPTILINNNNNRKIILYWHRGYRDLEGSSNFLIRLGNFADEVRYSPLQIIGFSRKYK